MSKSVCRLPGERLIVLFGIHLRGDMDNTYTSRSVGVALGLPSLPYSAGCQGDGNKHNSIRAAPANQCCL